MTSGLSDQHHALPRDHRGSPRSRSISDLLLPTLVVAVNYPFALDTRLQPATSTYNTSLCPALPCNSQVTFIPKLTNDAIPAPSSSATISRPPFASEIIADHLCMANLASLMAQRSTSNLRSVAPPASHAKPPYRNHAPHTPHTDALKASNRCMRARCLSAIDKVFDRKSKHTLAKLFPRQHPQPRSLPASTPSHAFPSSSSIPAKLSLLTSTTATLSPASTQDFKYRLSGIIGWSKFILDSGYQGCIEDK